jgi:two-component system, NtrC family, nitrogen regulation response regulator GlnG
MHMGNVLIVDDEQSICWGLGKLAREMGHAVAVAASAEQALVEIVRTPPDVILLDVRLPGMDGLTAIDQIRRRIGDVPIVIMTAHGDLAVAVEAVRKGAFDYLVKPFELHVAERALSRAIARRDGREGPAPDSSPSAAEDRIIGSSRAMREVFKRIAVVAPSGACVHLRGESGTGKEMVARAIHQHSRRSAGPFIAVNVASLSPSLAESELFGHVRGAFTGAEQTHPGLLQRAHGGSIFFDEVADIPLSIQVKLLRVLEYGEVLPVGGVQPIQCDFRVISATHQSLYQRVCEGTFRQDLYFRLVTFEIEIPPLRERRDDIAALTDYFLTTLATKSRVPEPSIPVETRADLARRDWWGNVRELRNALEHAMILARGGPMLPDHLPPPVPARDAAGTWDGMLRAMVRRWTEHQLDRSAAVADLYEKLLKVIEPPLFQETLRRHQGQFAAAARQLGMHRVTLKKKIDEHHREQ